MDINRDLNKVSLWKKYRKWSIYHDLELYQYSDTDYIWVTAITIISLFQKLSLIHIDFTGSQQINEVHKWLYQSFNDSLRGHTII